jgi:hypothetical protein
MTAPGFPMTWGPAGQRHDPKPMPHFSGFRQKCPRCAGKLRRSRRKSHEVSEFSSQGLRRYRCTETDCGWQGLLPKLARRSGRSSSRTQQTPLQHWLVPLALLAIVALGVAALSVRALRSETAGTPADAYADAQG